MEIPEILKALERYDEKHPRRALRQAMEQKEAITPHLLEALRYAREQGTNLPADYMLHTWAMYLLAQFRETRACPLIIDLMDFPSDVLEHLHGDFITEDLERILASVCGEDTSLIEQLAERPDADEYVRDAAVGALVILAATGRRSREETLEYLRHLFRTAQAPAGSFFWSGLVWNAMALYPEGLMEEIKQAFDRGLVEETFISFDEIENTLARGKDAVLAELAGNSRMRLIEDTVLETEWWASYQEPPSWKAVTQSTSIAPTARGALAAPYSLPHYPLPAHVGPKPGRNDPCPCGSGRKYKKCCLNK